MRALNNMNIYKNNIAQLGIQTKSSQLLENSLKKLLPTKKDNKTFLTAFIISIFLSFLIGTSPQTLKVFYDTLNISLTAMIGIFGCVFAIFSIIISVSNDGFIRILSKSVPKQSDTKAPSSTVINIIEYYESILYVYFFGLIVTLILSLLCKCIPNNFLLIPNVLIDNLIATSLICIYFTFLLRMIFELKSVIWNTVSLFKINIAVKNEKYDIENSKYTSK